jgi:hypothetical protein
MTNVGSLQSTMSEHAHLARATTTIHPASAAAAAARSSIIGKISVTSTATNYEILSDDTSGFTQAAIISEPYFDAQTSKNVTGLVGKLIFISL